VSAEVEVRPVREQEITQVLALWRAVWPDAPPGHFDRYFTGDENFQPEYTRIAVADGRVVSAAHVVRRTVSCGDAVLTLGGLANVATAPEFRGRGFASRVTEAALAVMAGDAMDLALLFSSEPGLFERFGFERLPAEAVSGAIRQKPAHTYGYATVRPYEDRDDAVLHLVHAVFNRHRPLAVRRSEPYWRDWVGAYRGQSPHRARVAEVEGAVVGYCLHDLDVDAGLVKVREFGVRPGAEAALGALLDEAAEDGLRHGLPGMRLPLPDHPAVAEAATRLLVDREAVLSRFPMVRLLNGENLLWGLLPELTDRWARAGAPEGRLALGLPTGPVALSGVAGSLRVSPSAEDDQLLGQADFVQLLMGRLPSSVKSEVFARALFPPLGGWFWELDAF
jgi:N-acetylglutamate synthase-like GNAT family acetyltransferase